MFVAGGRTHFTPKGVSTRTPPDSYKHATTTWLERRQDALRNTLINSSTPPPARFDVVHRFQLIPRLQAFYHFFYDLDVR